MIDDLNQRHSDELTQI